MAAMKPSGTDGFDILITQADLPPERRKSVSHTQWRCVRDGPGQNVTSFGFRCAAMSGRLGLQSTVHLVGQIIDGQGCHRGVTSHLVMVEEKDGPAAARLQVPHFPPGNT